MSQMIFSDFNINKIPSAKQMPPAEKNTALLPPLTGTSCPSFDFLLRKAARIKNIPMNINTVPSPAA
jgi:hypothetical protein